MWETWVGKIPWRKERLSTPVFWPGEFHRWVHGLPKSRTRLSDFHYTSSIDLGTVCLQVQDRFVPSFLRPVLGIVAAYVMDTVFSSVQFNHSVVSDSLQPPEPWHPRPPVHHQLLESTHPTSVVPFSSCLQSFPASGSFKMSQLFASGGQSIGVSASASVLPMNIQDWFPLGFDLLTVQGTLKSLLQHHSSKASILRHSAFFRVQLSHPYMTTGKTIALTRQTFVDNVSAF